MKKVDNNQTGTIDTTTTKSVKYPTRVLDFNKFRHVTEQTFLTDDELNLLGSLHEKDLSLADLEFLVTLRVAIKYDIKQHLQVNYKIRKIIKGEYKFHAFSNSNYEKPFRLETFINKYKIQGNISLWKLDYYSLITISPIDDYKLHIGISELGYKVVNEFLNSEKIDPLMKQLIDKVNK